VLWVGLILIVLAVVMFVFSGKAADKALFMKATETKKVGDVLSLIQEVSADLGGGPTGYAELAEFKGHFVTDEPVIGAFSNKPAAIVVTRVERQYEERTEVRDSDGNYRVEWRRGSETVGGDRQTARFWLDDGTGRVRIDPNGASLDLVRVVDRFEPPNNVESLSGGRMALRLGGVSLSIGGVGSTRRTVGYKFTEEALPLDVPAYVLGEVADTEEGLVVRKPADEDKKRPFVVSTKSEAELVRSAESSAKWLRLGSYAVGAGGVVLALMGLVG